MARKRPPPLGPVEVPAGMPAEGDRLRVALVDPLPGMRLGIAQMLERGGQYRVVLSVACRTQRKRPGDGPTIPAHAPM